MSKLRQVCRVCMRKEGKTKFQRILSENFTVAHDLFFTCGVMVVDIKEQPESMICSKCLDGVTAAAQMKKNAIKSDSFFRKRTKRDEQALWTFMPPVCKIEEVEQVEDTIVEVVLMTKKEEEDDVDNVAPLLETVDYSDSDNRSDRDEVIKDDDEDFFGPPEPKKVSKPAQPTKSLSKKRSANDSRKGIFECDCGKVFTYKTSLSDHITMMHKEVSESEMFSCHVCTKKFKLKYQVDRHIKKIHPEVKTEPKSKARKVKGVKKPRKGRFECWCGKVLSYKAGLADHVTMHHTIVPESEMFPCQICGKKFKLKSYVERHVKTTHAENKSTSKAPCTVCGLFITKSFLRSHEAKHFKPKDAPQKARIYSCDLCGRSVSEKFYMQLHFERVHLKLKKFKCKQCSAAFVHGTLLDSHVRNIHLNIKPYVCRYCPKAFLRPGCRKIHERIHTDERPYSCSFCDKTFIHHSDHRRHELRHTGGIPKKEFNARKSAKMPPPYVPVNEFPVHFPHNFY